ncbi:MAG: hypothetical protein SFU27_00350 [Thermonemataceae bacterium]|nr:hypothetical protein [Thermonemataceae bacterium]
MNINFSDCINCIQPIRMFNKIPPEFDPIMVFRESDKRIAKKFLEDRMNTKISESQIIYSDSLFTTLNNGNILSFAHITWRGIPIQSYRLSEFQSSYLEDFKNIQIETFKLLNDSTILGDDTNLFSNSNHLVLFDGQFQKVYIFETKTKKLIHLIEDKSFDKKNIYKEIFSDTTNYYDKIGKYEGMLEQVGAKYVKIVDVVVNKDKIYCMLSLSYIKPNLKKENSLHVLSKYVLMELSNNMNYSFYPIEESPLLEANGYLTLPIFNAQSYIQDNIIYTFLFHENPDSLNTYLVGKYEVMEKKKNKIKSFNFVGFGKVKYLAGIPYTDLSGHIFYPYYFFSIKNLVVDINSGESFEIMKGSFIKNIERNENGGIKLPFPYLLHCIFRRKDNSYNLFLSKENESYIYNFNANSKSSLLLRKIAVPPYKKFNLLSEYIFITEKTLAVLTNQNELIQINF